MEHVPNQLRLSSYGGKTGSLPPFLSSVIIVRLLSVIRASDPPVFAIRHSIFRPSASASTRAIPRMTSFGRRLTNTERRVSHDCQATTPQVINPTINSKPVNTKEV